MLYLDLLCSYLIMVKSNAWTQFLEGLYLRIQETSEHFRKLIFIQPQFGYPNATFRKCMLEYELPWEGDLV